MNIDISTEINSSENNVNYHCNYKNFPTFQSFFESLANKIIFVNLNHNATNEIFTLCKELILNTNKLNTSLLKENAELLQKK